MKTNKEMGTQTEKYNTIGKRKQSKCVLWEAIEEHRPLQRGLFVMEFFQWTEHCLSYNNNYPVLVSGVTEI